MRFGCLVKRERLWALFTGVGLGLSATTVHGQIFHRGGSPCPPPPCPVPEYKVPVPGTPMEPARPGAPTPPMPQTPSTDLSAVAPEASSLALGGESTSFAPNLIGDLLFGSRSVAFTVNRGNGDLFVNDTGSTSITNPKVAENNSPIPRDRFSFRYNYFDNALAVTGLSDRSPVFDPGIIGTRAFTRAKGYNVDLYTFGLEKTFCDQLFSVEVRVPFRTSLSSRLDLSYGTVVSESTALGVDPVTGQAVPIGANTGVAGTMFNVVTDPLRTLGNEDTEFGNMSVILKALLYQTPRCAFSGGLGIGIPTGRDVNIHVTDFLGNPLLNIAEFQRERTFNIQNETVSLSPFLAVLATPSDRLFAQGFVQVDFPLNDNEITYSHRFTRTVSSLTRLNNPLSTFPPLSGEVLSKPFFVKRNIDEQTLMHFDFGTGYWLLRNPHASWITGLAPTLELHYTTALENASVVTLPKASNEFIIVPGSQPGTVAAADPKAPTVGNLQNRVDILNLTVGTTVEVANRATIATGFAFPLKRESDRTFDWEFQLQLNYYFGGPRSRSSPNF